MVLKVFQAPISFALLPASRNRMEHKPTEVQIKYLKHTQHTFSNGVAFNIERNKF